MPNTELIEKNRIEVSGDAENRLSTAAVWLDPYPAGTEILIVGPSAGAADDLYLRGASSKEARFGIRRFLNTLGAYLALAAPAESELARASRLSFVAVVAAAILSLQSEGKLTYFTSPPSANWPSHIHAPRQAG